MRPGTWRTIVALGWCSVLVLGAANNLAGSKIIGRSARSAIPFLRYGYVMFSVIPQRVQTIGFIRNGHWPEHSLVELARLPALGYAEARIAMDAIGSSKYLDRICKQSELTNGDTISFVFDEYDVEPGLRRLHRSRMRRCGEERFFADWVR